MKILVFANIVPTKLGGYEEFVIRLSEKCAFAGDKCVIALGGQPCESAARKWREAGLEWEVVPGWTDEEGTEHPWRFIGPAVRLVRKHKPDVVAVRFGNEMPACAVALICKHLAGSHSRWVWEQDQQIADAGIVARRISRIRFVGMIFDHIVAVYNGGRRSLVSRGVSDDRISVIYNGVKEPALSRKRSRLRREIGCDESELLIGMVSSLIPRKRVDVAIKAFACAHLDRAMLVIVGGGNLKAPLEVQVKKSGLEGRVHFLGLRPDVAEIIAETDIFLHTSSAEACAYVICEAMAVGLPVIAADSGAAREQILDGETGFVVPAGDAEQTAERLARLARDRELRSKLGAAARARWSELFRVETMAAGYHEMYKKMAAGS